MISAPRICCLLAVSFALAGCVSKAKAKAQAQAAFAAGQQQAMIHMQQTQGPNVTVHGAVRNPLIPWTEDMTVAKAIVAANYYGAKDPAQILVVRKGRAFQVDPKQLLNGNDPPLEAGDLLDIK